MWVDIVNQGAVEQGFGIQQQGAFILFEYSKWGAVCGGEWYGNVSLATDDVRVYEVSFRPAVAEQVPDQKSLIEAIDRFDLACQIYA